MSTEAARLLNFTTVAGQKGTLHAIELTQEIPFACNRIYIIKDVPDVEMRGSHAHRDLHQVIVAVSGSLHLSIDDGVQKQEFVLSEGGSGMYLPPGYWRTLTSFLPSTVCLVLASAAYDPADYIRDYDEFLFWKAKQKESRAVKGFAI